MSELQEYFSGLEFAAHKLGVIKANIEVYSGMTNFKGTAPGSEKAANHYIKATKPIIKELEEQLGCRL